MSAGPLPATAPVDAPFAQTMRGVALVVASQFVFIVNDTFLKLSSATLPMGEVLFLRGLFCVILVGIACAASGDFQRLPLLRHRMVASRLLGELGGTFFFVLALVKMPIANATIIFQAVPLSVTAGAALFLGEIVGWRRWLAILIGFAGVLIVVVPGWPASMRMGCSCSFPCCSSRCAISPRALCRATFRPFWLPLRPPSRSR
jgi:drug/metabolite transporter (DMT)-like permease